MSTLDERVRDLAEKYRPLAAKILAGAIAIAGTERRSGIDPLSGMSNHEAGRLAYLKQQIIENHCVFDPKDVHIDAYGALVWTIEDPDDTTPRAEKRVIYFDGHTDTVNPLPQQWKDRLGEGVDAFDGLIDADKVNEAAIQKHLGYIPPKEEWKHLVFGRGSADQLAGVVSQIVSSKIMIELRKEGALKGVIIRSYGTVAEEDNDGGLPMFLVRELWNKNHDETLLPDCVVITEGTGDSKKGALGIYRGQRGRMTIEVEVLGKSCHGSMPHEGLNPLEFGARILVEATDRVKEGLKDDPFLSAGTRTASWAVLDTPSDCAVPERFVFRFDRRLTAGELPSDALKTVEEYAAVKLARDHGLTVKVRAPVYSQPTHTGYVLNNDQIYPSWRTPAEHNAVKAAVDVYSNVIGPYIEKHPSGLLSSKPRVDRWIFSTDGVGYVVDKTKYPDIKVPSRKNWISDGPFHWPPMFGFGAGFEQNTHKIGECVDSRELQHACAMLARFPSQYVALCNKH